MELVCQQELTQREGGRMLIIGTGFLARVFHQTVLEQGYDYEIDVIGKSNADYWGKEMLVDGTYVHYDVVVDLKGEDKIKFVKVNPNALVIMASAPHREYNFPLEDWLWSNVTIFEYF